MVTGNVGGGGDLAKEPTAHQKSMFPVRRNTIHHPAGRVERGLASR
jgi:hypothetical protein